MVFCNNCGKSVTATEDVGRIWCDLCGKVLVYDIYSTEPTFFKNAAGQSKVAGSFVRGFQSEVSASRERLMEKARCELTYLRNGLEMGENEEIIDIALRFYTMALERNFTKGRNTERVLAACLYMACRAKRKPYLLIEFSNLLKIDVYTLGGVFMQLCKVLYGDEYPFEKRLVDPSIFIERFSESVLGGRDKAVIHTAARIITSMKRNWMQTGRKPSGLCGAALYISALSHGLKCSKSDFLRVAYVCDATLTKRLSEFENTQSGSLTVEEFHLKETELEEFREQPDMAAKTDSIGDILCEHKDSGKPFAHGLCKVCYDEFMRISGGLFGGSDPPAFQRAEIERRKAASAQEKSSHSDVDTSAQSNFEGEVNSSGKMGAEACDESDNFSDIDDVEVEEYLLDEEGKRDKKIVWEALNREYIEEQAAKAAMGTECPEYKAATAKKRKERQQAKEAKERNSTPAPTAAEAAYETLRKKRLSSKINFSVLENMFKTSETADVSKKPRTDAPSDNDNEMPYMENQELENTDGFDPEYDEVTEGTDCENYQYNNGDEAYGDEEYDYRERAGYDDYY